MFDSLISKYIGSLVRNGLQYLAGLLTGVVVIDSTVLNNFTDATTALIVALATAGITLLWSLIQKKFSESK